MIIYFFFIAVPGFSSLFLLGSNLVSTPYYSVLNRFMLCYVRNFEGSVQPFSLNQQLKKRNEITQNETNPYHKNFIIEALNKNDIEKHICFLFFPLFFDALFLILFFLILISLCFLKYMKNGLLFNCKKNWTFYGLYFIELNIFNCIKSEPLWP